MIAIVSSISVLLPPASGDSPPRQRSNAYATVEALHRLSRKALLITVIVGLFAIAPPAAAQPQQGEPGASSSSRTQRATTVGLFLAGGALGLGAHEGGHLLFDVLFDADPGI